MEIPTRFIAEIDKKYMTDHDPNNELLHLMYWVLSNLCGQEMLQKLPLNSFKSKKDKFRFDEKLIGNYNEKSDKGYILEADVKHPKELHEQQSE